MTRIQFELPEDKVRELERLMAASGIKTKKEFFNNALTLLEWAIKEKKAGRTIASIDETAHSYKEIVMPVLSAVAQE